jgi:hypothetical protein
MTDEIKVTDTAGNLISSSTSKPLANEVADDSAAVAELRVAVAALSTRVAALENRPAVSGVVDEEARASLAALNARIYGAA